MENIKKDEFDKVFNLMKESFPESEYRPYEKQLKLLSVEEYKIRTKYDESGNLISFVAFWDFPEFVFVEHLAVSPTCRGMGLGTKIMQELIKSYDKPIILEIEPPKNETSVKRCEFYERLGFHICNYEYYQKPLREGQNKLRLNLMSYPITLNEKTFKYIQDYLLKQTYKTIT